MELAAALVIGGLAAARLATLITQDDFGPIADARNWLRYRWPAEDDAYYESEVVGHDDVGYTVRDRDLPVFSDVDPDGFRVFYPVYPHPLGTLLSCVRCMSVWTGLAVTILILTAPAWLYMPVLLPFAFSQITITLTKNE